RCPGGSTPRACCRFSSALDAKCARSPFSPTRRTRRTCASSTCTDAHAWSRKASASAAAPSTTSATRSPICRLSASMTRISNAFFTPRSRCVPTGDERQGRAPRHAPKCLRPSASPRLLPPETFYRAAHPGERLVEARALRREIEPHEARLAELRARRERDPVLEKEFVAALDPERRAVDPGKVGRLDMRHRQADQPLDEIAVAAEVLELRREPGFAGTERGQRGLVAEHRRRMQH